MTDLQRAREVFAQFVETIAALRHPQTGCPWDLQQDHATLRRYMIEEAYEAAEAMSGTDAPAVRDELGDVLLQVVLNAQIAQDAGTFSVVEVIEGIDAKMRRRHPHVFGGEKASWDAIKQQEKGAKPAHLFAEAENKQPAALQAHKIGKIASKISFDWDNPAEVFAQVRSEIAEVDEELTKGAGKGDARLAEEIGDVYFSLAQLCRHLDLDPELVAFDANRKFLRRFKALEAVAAERGIQVDGAPRATLEELWVEVKKREKVTAKPSS